MDGDPFDPIGDHLDLTGMDPGPDLHPHVVDRLAGGDGAPNSSGRTVERCEEPVARSIDLVTVEAGQLVADDRAMGLEEVSPPAVSRFHDTLGRADDVREQDRREDPIGSRGRPDAGEELFELVQDRILILEEGELVCAG